MLIRFRRPLAGTQSVLHLAGAEPSLVGFGEDAIGSFAAHPVVRSVLRRAVWATVLAACLLTSPAIAATPPSAEGAHEAVATDSADATLAAMQVLHQGGNAADAAVAAALVLGVVAPTGSGLGGGGFALVYSAKDGKVTALDFRESAPAALDAADLFANQGPHRGQAVGVPGEPAGLEQLQKRFGRKTLAEVVAPAVALARDGFFANSQLAGSAAFFKDRLTPAVTTSLAPELFTRLLPNGVPIAPNTRIVRPVLARTLQRFGAEGARALYEGPLGEAIVRAVQAHGGRMQAADLRDYRVIERAPLQKSFGARTVYTMPAPSGGGLMLLEVLGLFGADSSSELSKAGPGSSATFHLLAEGMRGAVIDRVRHAADPDLEPGTDEAYARLLEPASLAKRRKQIKANATRKLAQWTSREQGTTHLVVADREGNVVSLTTTVNAPFGAGIEVPEAGIVLNDELNDFSRPEDIAGFGVRGLGPNRPRPGARPVSSMCPTVVLEAGKPILALGGSGGLRIATEVTQTAVSRLVFGLDPLAAVSAPRVHVPTNAKLLIEEEVASDVLDGLRKRGEVLDKEPRYSPAVQMIAIEREGGEVRVKAASDPRKSGFAAAR